MSISDQAVFTIPEVCAVARASRSAVYEAIKSGALIARKRGRRTILLGPDVRAWLEATPQLDPTRRKSPEIRP